ncbi:MAG: DNA gyrase subunit A [Candidatus Micrarchaeota archaeon]|nr:DNA gyrase subunit A [Candidatus Micrarchaeota archaeon]
MSDYRHGKIETRPVEREMRSSYLDYAMSVIVGRALPDVRDGLKPVHRRVLYAMYEIGNTHDKPFKKSARVVGEVLGKYHPHGDMAIYDSMVRMAQDFSLRYPLVEGQGNFGSVDGDNAAAMRYTEVRLNRFAEEMLADIEKETVDFAPNFDATLKEPLVLPSKVPNLLVNGSSGIAVGMATNMPPHNLSEICDALVALIDNPQLGADALSEIVRGPDFPTAGCIIGRRGILEAQRTGKGIIRVRGRAEIVQEAKGKTAIVVRELPYQVNKSEFVRSVAELARDKRIEGIADIADRSDRRGMHVHIELKRDANPEIVLNQLYARTALEGTFGIINLALVRNEPRVLSLHELLREFLLHRKEVVTRRCRFELNVAKERKHIVEGLLLALARIEDVIRVVKSAGDAKAELMAGFGLSDKQAEAILEMKIRKLTRLESGKLKEEDSELAKTIARLTETLADERKIYGMIREELADIKQKYGDKRRTEIVADEEEGLGLEDLIAEEDVAVVITQDDYIKRVPISEYRAQRRGGKGVIGAETKEEDRIKDVILASTHDYLLFFTNRGMVHWLKVYQLPAGNRYSMGKAIVNLLELEGEKIAAWVRTRQFREDEYLVMLTKNGIVKRSSMGEYSHPRKGGIIAITLRENDALIDAKKTDGRRELIIATERGLAIRFKEEEVRQIGRVGQGVIGIRLEEGDAVAGMAMDDAPTLMTVCENGYGKRTAISEYRLQSRGGRGVINIKTEGRNGKVVGIVAVDDADQLLLVSSSGKMIRLPVRDVSVIGRNTAGVRLMKLEEGEKIAAVEKISGDEAEGAESSGKKGGAAESPEPKQPPLEPIIYA